jgi:predicted HTH transcriptional regulator
MEISQIKRLLAAVENPKLEFKSRWYCNTDRLDDQGWGEFLKDIIGLANGNIGYIGKTSYLIIGVSDTDPAPNKTRETFHVEAIGMLSNLQKIREITLRKIRETCSPPLSDIKIYFINLEENKNTLILEIPSPIDVIQLDRDLNTRGMRFQKGTVLIRLGQDISVASPTQIIALKQEYNKLCNDTKENISKILHNLPKKKLQK